MVPKYKPTDDYTDYDLIWEGFIFSSIIEDSIRMSQQQEGL